MRNSRGIEISGNVKIGVYWGSDRRVEKGEGIERGGRWRKEGLVKRFWRRYNGEIDLGPELGLLRFWEACGGR